MTSQQSSTRTAPQSEPTDSPDGTATRLRYRLLTGPDDVRFCRRVSDALDDGYRLHGSPAIAFDSGTNSPIVAQAIVLPEA